MGIRRPALSTAVAAALIGSFSVPIVAGTASAKDGAATVREDFNGDGYQDLAVAAPGGTVGGHTWAGYITITYGSAHDLDPERTMVITQDTPGVPGVSSDNAQFGYDMISRDLDGDGLTDLALVTREYRPENNIGGSVIVLWGRKLGMSGQDAVRLDAPANAQVGEDITAGDFDGDGHTDLFMGNSEDSYDYHDVLYGPIDRDGSPAREQRLQVYSTDNTINSTAAGDFNGDGIEDLATFYVYENHAEGGKLWLGTKEGLSTVPQRLTSAAGTAVADFDQDGYADLATRIFPNGDTENVEDPGTVKIYYGSPAGPSQTRTRTITQNTAGVPGVSEKSDQFGGRLSAGDVNGDGYADLAVGVPGEAIGSKKKAGAVVLLKGGRAGLTGTGAQAFHQDTAGVPGVAESGDLFGGSVRLLDVTRDGKADLVAGAPGENLGVVVNGGAVWLLRGTASGITASKSVAVNPMDLGAPSVRALFGENLSGDNGPGLAIP
ncbi:FG-GAP-like repeat-containing protein [Streptomyces sp. NBC_00638]|uniref:FG-GAP-like repeat-containing protein n=1 Tax=Streptomyces sp. NBC_00638 TaxID=2975794 RepID=UPI00225632BE|nr:FG-GAP-like repeat-containing protein [Streptomyces sp. NBC_00638]MCX5008424.1 FG-GAP-like repeat-containing protein [Streptomyces sp. NBC_00638]